MESWNQGNVCQWIMNDEGLYNCARRALRMSSTRDEAARRMLKQLPSATPDGAPYTFTSVRAVFARGVL